MKTFLSVTGSLSMILLVGTSTPHVTGFKEMRVALEEDFCTHATNVHLLELFEHRMVEHTHEDHSPTLS